ncbi:hypothetical protein DAI22_01g202750 [Oryza sativa Japonica Group]|nr:hypothetical protein DAI22_01g202750 [Oryza sativa Japonica Group]
MMQHFCLAIYQAISSDVITTSDFWRIHSDVISSSDFWRIQCSPFLSSCVGFRNSSF